MRTRQVPSDPGRYYYVLILGLELVERLGLAKSGDALVEWGNGVLRVSKAPEVGPRWGVRRTQAGDALIALSSLPIWVRRDLDIEERGLSRVWNGSSLIITVPQTMRLP